MYNLCTVYIQPFLLRIVASDSDVRQPCSMSVKTDSIKYLKLYWSSTSSLVIWSTNTATLLHCVAPRSNSVMTWRRIEIETLITPILPNGCMHVNMYNQFEIIILNASVQLRYVFCSLTEWKWRTCIAGMFTTKSKQLKKLQIVPHKPFQSLIHPFPSDVHYL